MVEAWRCKEYSEGKGEGAILGGLGGLGVSFSRMDSGRDMTRNLAETRENQEIRKFENQRIRELQQYDETKGGEIK